MQVTLIHNPGAGDECMGERELRARLEDAGHRVSYRSTRVKGWKDALDRPGDCVIAAGGDGTVAKVARQLAGRAIPLGILPSGTANNIATSLGLEAATSVLIERLSSARPVAVDLGLARGPWGERHFFESFGLGLFPALMARSAEAIPKGASPPAEELRQNVELMLEMLDEAVPIECGITADGRDLSGEYLLVETMNVRYMGPRIDLAPDANHGDGLLDVVTISEAERRTAADFLRASASGERFRPGLVRCRAKSIEVRCLPTAMHVDDEPWPPGDDGSTTHAGGEPICVAVTVHPDAVQILL